MNGMIQAILVATLIAGLFSQNIVTDNSSLISQCTVGARSDIDRYLLSGTIGDNIKTALNQKWMSVVLINVLKTTSQQYDTICQLNLGVGTCQPVPTYSFVICECFYNTNTDQAHFIVSTTVQADSSNAVMYAQWKHENGTVIYSDKSNTFPEVYDVNAAHLHLAVAGVTENLPSRSCSFNLTLNRSNDLELCCSKTAEPCYPQILFDGAVVTGATEMCVTYPTSLLTTDVLTTNLGMSYSVCDFNDNRQGSFCTVASKTEVHVKGVHKDSHKPLDSNIAIIILLSVILPMTIIAIAFGITYYFTAQTWETTGESAPKADQQEQHKQDEYERRGTATRDVIIYEVTSVTHETLV